MVLGDLDEVFVEGDLRDVDDAGRRGPEQAEDHAQHVARALPL